MDYSTLTDNNGRKADFRNAVLIMTSNAGAREIGKPLLGFGERVNDESAIDDAVEKLFSPEFRNRLDSVVAFSHLSPDVMQDIVRKEIAVFKEQLAAKNVSLDISDGAIAELACEGYSKEFGARNVGRLIEDKIKSRFVDEVLFGALANGGIASVDCRGGEYAVNVSSPVAL
jgi:ATP-dependent Clp protease ATP-binding subunit ClpA